MMRGEKHPIVGTISDETGTPIGDATMTIVEAPFPMPEFAQRANHAGEVSLFLPPGEYVIEAIAGGRRGRARVVVAGAPGRFHIVLPSPSAPS